MCLFGEVSRGVGCANLYRSVAPPREGGEETMVMLLIILIFMLPNHGEDFRPCRLNSE